MHWKLNVRRGRTILALPPPIAHCAPSCAALQQRGDSERESNRQGSAPPLAVPPRRARNLNRHQPDPGTAAPGAAAACHGGGTANRPWRGSFKQ